MSATWTRGEVRLPLPDGMVGAQLLDDHATLPALICGPLAVCRAWAPWGWIVFHLPLQTRVCCAAGPLAAVRAVRQMLATDLDWSQTDPAYYAGQREAFRPVYEQLRQRGCSRFGGCV